MTKQLHLLSALTCTIIWALTACDKPAADPTPEAQTAVSSAPVAPLPQTPNEVLNAYYDAMQQGKWEAAYALVDPDDQAARPFEQFTKILSTEIRQRTSRLQTVEILEIEEQDDRAVARVKSTRPDIARIQRKLFAEHGADVAKDAERVQALLLAELDKPDHLTLTREQDVLLRKVDSEWRLNFDWDEPTERRPPVTARPPR